MKRRTFIYAFWALFLLVGVSVCVRGLLKLAVFNDEVSLKYEPSMKNELLGQLAHWNRIIEYVDNTILIFTVLLMVSFVLRKKLIRDG